MKASESVKNYAASVRMYTNYTVREIKKMCKEIGPRPAGSESEKKAQEYITGQMKTCADEVTMEPFEVSPKAFMSFIKICGTFLLFAVAFLAFALRFASREAPHFLQARIFTCLPFFSSNFAPTLVSAPHSGQIITALDTSILEGCLMMPALS